MTLLESTIAVFKKTLNPDITLARLGKVRHSKVK